MATLSASEIVKTRQMIGDTTPTTASEFDLTNEQIQEEWDRADGHSGEEEMYLAYYYMVERRYGIWINSINTETADGAKQQQQKVQNIEKLLDHYSKKAGLGQFTIPSRAGVLDFDYIENESTEYD